MKNLRALTCEAEAASQRASAALQKVAPLLAKGDKPGHEFRGNQYTNSSGGGSGGSGLSEKDLVDKVGKLPDVDADHRTWGVAIGVDGGGGGDYVMGLVKDKADGKYKLYGDHRTRDMLPSDHPGYTTNSFKYDEPVNTETPMATFGNLDEAYAYIERHASGEYDGSA